MTFAYVVPFIEHLGMKRISAADGAAEYQFEPKLEHMNSHGVVHGGACMTLLDISMAYAALSVGNAGDITVTIEMKCNFLQPAIGELRGHAHLVHRTSRLAFVEARLIDLSGKVCTTATGTFRYLNSSRQLDSEKH